MPENELQKAHYMTILLDQINLYNSNIAAYKANLANHENEIIKIKQQITKLELGRKPIKAEYKLVQAKTFPEVAETKPKEVKEPEKPKGKPVDLAPETEPKEDDKELDVLLEKRGITRRQLKSFLATEGE